jgi:hypothetical protein
MLCRCWTVPVLLAVGSGAAAADNVIDSEHAQKTLEIYRTIVPIGAFHDALDNRSIIIRDLTGDYSARRYQA